MKFNCPEGTTVLQKLEFYVIFFLFQQTDDGYKKYENKMCTNKKLLFGLSFISCWKEGSIKKFLVDIRSYTK